jgi:catechol-2,3-dioxygenase
MTTAPKPITRNQHPIAPGVSIGHVHLKVSDLNRATKFYCGVLGFDLMQRYGDEAAFLSAGGYHHHIALNTWESKGGRRHRRVPPACIILPLGIRRGERSSGHVGLHEKESALVLKADILRGD